MKFLQASLVLLGLSLTTALPTKSEESAAEAPTKSTSFASKASQIIATNLLKSYNDIDGNQVHSPLGVTTLLAILAEASRGVTYDEFLKVLGYPKERNGLRETFKQLLGQYQTRGFGVDPSFQTWMFIYRNFTAKEDYKNLVRDYYFVEVKDINQEDYDLKQPPTDTTFDSLDSLEFSSTSNSKDVVGFETLKRIKVEDDDDQDVLNMPVTTVGAYTDSYGEEVIEKETSKFDRFVDDKQYVEKPQIIEEIKKQQQEADKLQPEKEEQLELEDLKAVETAEKLELLKEKPVNKEAISLTTSKAPIVADKVAAPVPNKIEEASAAAAAADNDAIASTTVSNAAKDEHQKEEVDLNLQENETVQDKEKILKNYNDDSVADVDESLIVPIQELLASNEPEKVSLPLQKLESVLDEATSKKEPGEIMLALESHVSSARSAFGGRSLFRKDDITSALSANSITGREEGSKTKMLLFNGLYYRGLWATPFVTQKENEEFFFMTSEDAMKAAMIHAKGSFQTAELKHLNAKVLCLPYENKRYSMMIILPNKIEGLHSVISKLQTSDFELAKSLMEPKDLHVILPKFQIEETSRSASMLKGLGLTKLFSQHDADLGLLADDQDLHVEEVVQFVNVRVDEDGNANNALSATATQARNKSADDTQMEKFEATHPFVYFVMDCQEEFVLVSGKVLHPEIPDFDDFTVEVEFEKA